MPKLTEKQERFAQEYLKDLNATQAAIRCEYSEKTAYSQGQRLLKNVEVKKIIDDGKKERTESTKITTDWVITELQKQYLFASDAMQSQAALKALELLGKHTGAFTDKLKISGDVENPLQHTVKISTEEIDDKIKEYLKK